MAMTQNRRKRLGEMLVDSGHLTEEDLLKHINVQKKSGLKLGEFLIKEGVVSEARIVDMISKQAGIKKYNPDNYPVSSYLSKYIDKNSARKYLSAPLNKKFNLLQVAMTDPLDIRIVDSIEVETNMEVEPVICTEQEFNHLFSIIYGSDVENELIEEGRAAAEEMDFKDEPDQGSYSEDTEISSLQNMAEEAPVIRLVNALLSQAIKQGASDVHISPERTYVQVRFRIDGKLQEVPGPPKSMFLSIISRLKILAHLDISISRIPQDGRFSVQINNKEINIRVSTIPTIYGENLVMRLLNTSTGILTLDQMGLYKKDKEKLLRAVKRPYGMILATGPTGSGKSTTLFALLNEINKPDINIITLEDPVEYRMEKIRQAQLNRKAGMTFANGLKSILRQDPDVIMVGEIRDSETAGVATQAALTGHLVFSTVHTNDSAGAITRFIDMGIEPFLVSSVMVVSIAQRLIRKICPYCAEPYSPPQKALEFMDLQPSDLNEFKKGKGCSYCFNTGYKGRMGIYEILEIDDEVQEMILSGKTSRQISLDSIAKGKLRTLKKDAAQKAAQGLTTIEEAASGVMN
ncbi:MAG: ATPase, T2SS/T4P/T4SS family [Desulforegulaceae bacterium]|nr:ATPase, T2SS/T4P/T4SS family [Desulforegulaceae bacterium]